MIHSGKISFVMQVGVQVGAGAEEKVVDRQHLVKQLQGQSGEGKHHPFRQDVQQGLTKVPADVSIKCLIWTVANTAL